MLLAIYTSQHQVLGIPNVRIPPPPPFPPPALRHSVPGAILTFTKGMAVLGDEEELNADIEGTGTNIRCQRTVLLPILNVSLLSGKSKSHTRAITHTDPHISLRWNHFSLVFPEHLGNEPFPIKACTGWALNTPRGWRRRPFPADTPFFVFHLF